MKNSNAVFFLQSLAGGGMERNMINIAKHLLTHSIKFQFILFDKKNEYAPAYKTILKKVPKVIINKKRFLFSPFSLFTTLYKSKNTVYVGTGEFLPYYAAVFFAFLFRKKSILCVGNNIHELLDNLSWGNRIFHTMFLKLVFRLANVIVCTSYGVKYDIKKRFQIDHKKLKVIYNGVDLSFSSNRLKANKKKYSIVACGRLTQQKGFTHLLNTFKMVSDVLPHVELQILGKGELKNILRAQARKLGLSKKVAFIGFVKKPTHYFKRATLFVSSSLYEGFGNVLVEAMSCGVPIISSNCRYGPQEIVNGTANYAKKDKDIMYGKWGILTPAINHTDNQIEIKRKELIFARAIISLLRDKKLQLTYSKASIKRSSSFSTLSMTMKISSLL